MPLTTIHCRVDGAARHLAGSSDSPTIQRTSVRINGIYGLLFVAVILALPGCSTTAAAAHLSPSPATSPSSAPSEPSPVIAPAQARIAVTYTWERIENSLGDVSENLVFEISPNVPVGFRGFPTVFYRNQNISGSVSFAVEFSSGEQKEWTLEGNGQTFPRGAYTFWLNVPSYSTPYAPQVADYTSWVGGERGPLLAGNPQAITDPQHPAVLDLRAVAVAQHP